MKAVDLKARIESPGNDKFKMPIKTPDNTCRQTKCKSD